MINLILHRRTSIYELSSGIRAWISADFDSSDRLIGAYKVSVNSAAIMTFANFDDALDYLNGQTTQ